MDEHLTPLGRWMKAHGHRDQWLADKLGCTQPQACRIRNGARTSPERAFKLEKITRGKVKAADLLTAAPLPSANDTQSKAEAA